MFDDLFKFFLRLKQQFLLFLDQTFNFKIIEECNNNVEMNNLCVTFNQTAN